MTAIRRAPVRALTVVGLTLGVMGLTGSLAFAAAEDPRGERGSGNVTTCEQAGLDGQTLERDTDFTFTGGGSDDQFVTITGLADGVSVSGIVVKGGPAYNVYEPGERGLPEETPWEDLQSPLNRGGNIPTISHWYVCGTVEDNPPIDPMDPPIDPMDPPIDPMDPPIDPMDPPIDPMDPPIDPMDPPTDPTDPTDPGKGGDDHAKDECAGKSKEPCSKHDSY